MANAAAILRRYPSSAAIYLPNGLPPVPPYQGAPSFFRLGALPDTLERLSHAGLRDFYEGDVARALAADLKAMGAVLDADDLRGCEAQIRPCTELPYAGGTLQLAGGLTASPTFARVLALMRPSATSPTRPGSRPWPAPCAPPTPNASKAWAMPTRWPPRAAPRTSPPATRPAPWWP